LLNKYSIPGIYKSKLVQAHFKHWIISLVKKKAPQMLGFGFIPVSRNNNLEY
jgi:hypothetical protein